MTVRTFLRSTLALATATLVVGCGEGGSSVLGPADAAMGAPDAGDARSDAGVPATDAGEQPPDAANTRRYPPDVTMERYTQPAEAQPAMGATVTNVFSPDDPTQNTVTLRTTPRMHHYPKNQPWNSDETLLLLGSTPFVYTSSVRFLVDGATYTDLKELYADQAVWPGEHRTWSNVNPNYIYGAASGERQWVRIDVSTTPATTVALKTYAAADVGLQTLTKISFGSYEGNLDDNDTGAVLLAAPASELTRAFLIDPKTGAVRCHISSGGAYGNVINDATMSHDGRFIVVAYGPGGGPLDVYDASDCSYRRRVNPTSGHYDVCVSAAGEQVLVHSNSGSFPRMSSLSGENLAGTSSTDQIVFSTETTPDWHVSCRNIYRPGWAYVSYSNYTCGSTQQTKVGYQRIFAVKLDTADGDVVENFAWAHQACPATEAGVAFAVPSRWGDRVWWKANWDGGTSFTSYVAYAP